MQRVSAVLSITCKPPRDRVHVRQVIEPHRAFGSFAGSAS